MNIRVARHLRVGALLLALGAVAACNDPIEVDNEPKVTAFRVLAVKPGGQTETITVTANSQNPASVNLPSGTAITVEFLRADNTLDPIVNPTDFELRVIPVTAGVTFTPTSRFGGVLNTSSAGTKSVNLQLFHTGANHEELEFLMTFTS